MRAIGVALAVALLYLLSFGPVEHYCGRIITLPPGTSTTVTVSGQTVTHTTVLTVRYPFWVGVIYRPAFMVRGNTLYRRYLQWWAERPKPTD